MQLDPDSPVDRDVDILNSTETDYLPHGNSRTLAVQDNLESGSPTPVRRQSNDAPHAALAQSWVPPRPIDNGFRNAINSSRPTPMGVSGQSVTVMIPPSKYKPLPYATGRSGLVYDVRMRFHEDPWELNHPEDPRRIASIFKEFVEAGLVASPDNPYNESEFQLARILMRSATKEEICLIHTEEHVDWVESLSTMTSAELSKVRTDMGDMNSIYVNNLTWMCAMLSAGGCIEATKAVVTGQVKNAVALVRPPGHHAEHGRAEGFCFFNNVPIATRVAQIDYPELVRKVLILDWDVHHGNGIQRAFYDDPNVLYISIHAFEHGTFYPGPTFGDWGDHLHCGKDAGLGRNINIPWTARDMGDAEYIYAFQNLIMPIAVEFDPDLVFISAGFDAAEGDPLGGCHVSPACYGHMAHMLMQLAHGKVVACLEGGYNLESIAKSACSMTRVMMGEPPDRMAPLVPKLSGIKDVHMVVRQQAKFWKCMFPKDRGLNKKNELGSERLHDIIREWQSEKLWAEHKMVPLFVLREKLSKSFENQVLATENYYGSQPLLVIFHDPPEATGSPDTVTNKLELHNTWLTDVAKRYVDWAIKQKWAVIDVNIPNHITKPNDTKEYEESEDSEERARATKELAIYLWDNYIDMADSTHLFFVGIGDAHRGIADLFNKRGDALHRVDLTIGFVADNALPGVRGSDELDERHYHDNSAIFIAPDHPAFDGEFTDKGYKKPRRRCGRLYKSTATNLQEMLNDHQDQVFDKFLDLTEDWRMSQKAFASTLSNGCTREMDVTMSDFDHTSSTYANPLGAGNIVGEL